jgi:hypothetical protein
MELIGNVKYVQELFDGSHPKAKKRSCSLTGDKKLAEQEKMRFEAKYADYDKWLDENFPDQYYDPRRD